MTKSEDEFIDAMDFVSIILKIALTNLTTQAEIRNGKRSFGTGMEKPIKGEEAESFEVRIYEFLEDGFMLEVPSKTCAVNHSIALEVVAENSNPKVNFSANLKVLNVEKMSSVVDLIQAKFVQKSNQEWEALQSLYNLRQSQINQFLSEVKGNDSQ